MPYPMRPMAEGQIPRSPQYAAEAASPTSIAAATQTHSFDFSTPSTRSENNLNKDKQPPQSPLSPRGQQGLGALRPTISHLPTSERLRLGGPLPDLQSTTSLPRYSFSSSHSGSESFKERNKFRNSKFREVGLDDDYLGSGNSNYTLSKPVEEDQSGLETDKVSASILKKKQRPRSSGVANRGSSDSYDSDEKDNEVNETRDENRNEAHDQNQNRTFPISPREPQPAWYHRITRPRRPVLRTATTAPAPATFTNFPTLALVLCLIAIMATGRGGYQSESGSIVPPAVGVDAGLIRIDVPASTETLEKKAEEAAGIKLIEDRSDSPTDICTRWSHMTTIVNGTMYIYGGQATTYEGQVNDTWNNNFLTLDITKTWSTSSPSISGLPQPSGPPAVASGWLWNSYDTLWVYGGEFADNPYVEPDAVSTWSYDISSASWTEHSSPQTSAGNNTDGGGIAVQRVAEGPGISIPELGLSFYFTGHEDLSTTPGWSDQIAREYLTSLLEFTHPTYTNNGVYALAGGSGAGSDGVYRNITQDALQTSSSFSRRADGALVYVPGWGASGMLLAFGGGTADEFVSLSTIDIYDIATSTFYSQTTSGTTPTERVNPCAVVAAAPDGSSFNIYMYGGQNLQPYGDQVQYDDMWILTIPSFTWIQVDTSSSSSNAPPARAGHTCDIWDGQIIVVGGYLGSSYTECDSPGIYVFNASSLTWSDSFTSLSAAASEDEVSNDVGSNGFAGSYGYSVPDVVQSVIGGSSTGGATASTPAVGSATSGPIATGKPPTWTVTVAGGGTTVTQTAGPTSTGKGTSPTTTAAASGSGDASGNSGGSSINVGAVAAGAVAGALALLALYMGFCAWLYRRQLAMYKNHVAMAQRAGLGMGYGAVPGEENGDSAYHGGPGGGGGGAGAAAGLAGAGAAMGAAAGRRRSGSWKSYRSSAGSTLGTNGMLFDNGHNNGHRRSSSDGTVGAFGTNIGQPTSPTLQNGGSPYRWPPTVYGGAGGISDIMEEDGEMDGDASKAAMRNAHGYEKAGTRTSGESSVEDLLAEQELSFISVVMSPRRTLRVINRD